MLDFLFTPSLLRQWNLRPHRQLSRKELGGSAGKVAGGKTGGQGCHLSVGRSGPSSRCAKTSIGGGLRGGRSAEASVFVFVGEPSIWNLCGTFALILAAVLRRVKKHLHYKQEFLERET